MCEERERLIGYVYEECEPAERRAIEEHLAGCHTCRREIGGLRGVRQDLLAWEVPAHEAIWRPAPPARVESRWQVFPAWAMAAAAGLVLVAGAAGGAVTYALIPHGGTQIAAAAFPAPAGVVPVSLTSPDLSAIEQRVLQQLRAEVDAHIKTMAAAQPPVESARASQTTNDLARQVSALSSQQQELARTLFGVYSQIPALKRGQSDLMTMVSLTQDQGNAQGNSNGR